MSDSDRGSVNRDLSTGERVDWLRLSRSENVGPITFFKLLERFGSAGEALSALPDLARQGGLKRRIKVADRGEAEDEIAAVEKIGGRLIAWGENDYPPMLVHIDDAPPLITALGNAHLLKKKALAMVGTRNASLSGRKFARDMAAALGKRGILVVSGMARGIDTAAHTGAMETGTVAVLAGGVDVVYPRENQPLYEDLMARGAVLSEQPLGLEPQATHFPRRNRLISGMARGVVVLEATKRSGSLITARLASEQGREVFAVPGSPMDPRSAGANYLLRQGATLVETADDVMEVLDSLRTEPLMEQNRHCLQGPSEVIVEEKELNNSREIVENCLGPVPIEVDEIIRECQLSLGVVSTVLLELELAGRLERHPGNRVSLL